MQVKEPELSSRKLSIKESIQNKSDPPHIVNQTDKLLVCRCHNKASPLL